jgi:hypothetical protein
MSPVATAEAQSGEVPKLPINATCPSKANAGGIAIGYSLFDFIQIVEVEHPDWLFGT